MTTAIGGGEPVARNISNNSSSSSRRAWLIGAGGAAVVLVVVLLAFSGLGSPLRAMFLGGLDITADQVGPTTSGESALSEALAHPVGTTLPDDFFMAAGSEAPVAVQRATVKLTITSRYGHPVTIDEIRVDVVDRGDPLAGTLFARVPSAPDADPDLLIAADGDQKARTADGSPMHLIVGPHQTVTVSVGVTSSNCLCRFVFSVSSTVDGTHHTDATPGRSQPLVVTGPARQYGAMYLGIPDGWESVNRTRLCSEAAAACP
jgi:hypothetical protein